MSNPLHLISGQQYVVVKSFTDYDRIVHPPGETWMFARTNFLPYEDGLTLHVIPENSNTEIVYRLQWRNEEQAEIIDNFKDFVKPV